MRTLLIVLAALAVAGVVLLGAFVFSIDILLTLMGAK